MHEYTIQTTVLESQTLGQPGGQLSSQECQPLDHLEAGTPVVYVSPHIITLAPHTLSPLKPLQACMYLEQAWPYAMPAHPPEKRQFISELE